VLEPIFEADLVPVSFGYRPKRSATDALETIRNPLLGGWGNYFRTGNAAREFNQLDSYVWMRLRRLLLARYGRNLHAGRADVWTRDWFVERHGLHRLRGTVRYPGAA
jgi:RNA-directed DNA polymerase